MENPDIVRWRKIYKEEKDNIYQKPIENGTVYGVRDSWELTKSNENRLLDVEKNLLGRLPRWGNDKFRQRVDTGGILQEHTGS